MSLPAKPLSLDLSLTRKLKLGKAFQKRAARAAAWRQANPDEHSWLKSQTELEQFGDFLFLTSNIEDELWLLIERTWHGFPDPPQYAFFAFGLDHRLIVAKDLDDLPTAWAMPDAPAL